MTAKGPTTIHPVALSALDGRDPLGFLAGLGVTRLLDPRGDRNVRLSWDPETGMAVITSSYDSIDAVESTLVDQISSLPNDALLPGLPKELLPGRIGSAGSDPARIDIESLGRLVDDHRSDDRLIEWIGSLWTDLADDNNGRCARTPFNAPTGQMTFRSMFEKPLERVQSDPARWVSEALRGWTREPTYTGEGFDSRAVRDGAEVSDTKMTSYGVPGATFLALNALPLFRLSGTGVLARGDKKLRDRSTRATVAWRMLRGPDDRRSRGAFVWPLWRQPLDLDALCCLLDHAEVGRWVGLAVSQPTAPRQRSSERLAALGVWAVVAASRRKGAAGKSEGVLTVEHTWYPPR